MAYPVRHPSIEPTHPGELLRDEVLPAAELSVSEAARRLGVSRQMLHRVLACEASISPDMAARLGRLFGNGPRLWLRMQQEHDLWQAERALGPELAKIEPVRAA